MVPGTYTIHIALGGQTYSEPLTVKGDPRDALTAAQYQAGYDFARKYSTDYGKIDEALNNLDSIKKSLSAAATAAGTNASIKAQIATAQQAWTPVFGAFTADYKNDEDSIQRPGSLRESVPRTSGFGGVQLPPTKAQLDYAQRFDTAYNAAIAGFNQYVSSLAGLQSALKQAGLKPLEGVTPVMP